MPVRLTILGSGSSGNSALLETDDTRILVDAGFSVRQTRLRLASVGRSPESLTAILITHEHSDHIQGLAGMADKLEIPVYCNRPTKDAIAWTTKTEFRWNIFTTGASFEIGDISVDTFSIPHDAQEPVGYLLRTTAGNVGFATDLGHVTKLVTERIRPANALVLETNHDVKMLQDCPHRPWSLKQRILGRQGHLSNEAAAACAEEIMSDALRHLYLGHISSQCNKPELALSVIQRSLQRIGATHCQATLTTQRTPNATLTL